MAGLFITAATAGAQGLLNPTSTPAPCMVTLDQIQSVNRSNLTQVLETRGDIDSIRNTVWWADNKADYNAPRVALSGPCTIGSPGSYYLTQSFISTGDGIRITASDVTLDMMGFTITGDYDHSDTGIWIDSDWGTAPRYRVVIRNGSVYNFGYGVEAQYLQDGRLENLRVGGNRYYGISLSGYPCNGNSIVNCRARGNGLNGIILSNGRLDGNRIERCTFSGNGGLGIYLCAGSWDRCSGNTVRDCTVSRNSFAGIWLYGWGGDCRGNVVRDCTVSQNQGEGILLDGENGGHCTGNTVRDCSVSGNADYGVYLNGSGGQCSGNTIEGCAISANGAKGIYVVAGSGEADGNAFRNCAVSGNGSLGIYLNATSSVGSVAGTLVEACAVSGNGWNGIGTDWADHSVVRDCLVYDNDGSSSVYTYNSNYGLFEGNHCVDDDAARGIRTGGLTNMMFRNSSYGHTNANYAFFGSLTYGPVYGPSGQLPDPTHAKANFTD
ncbi:MAG: right-handed parallel beta-helix repeat-containing protein [Lentisphaerae bacterium]|nr:right-handed parallel beta-helix repeat-containing protein [Lentisphaerota bacterium]